MIFQVEYFQSLPTNRCSQQKGSFLDLSPPNSTIFPQGPWRGLPRMRCHQRYQRLEAFFRRWLAAVQGSEVSLVMIQWSPSKSTKTISSRVYLGWCVLFSEDPEVNLSYVNHSRDAIVKSERFRLGSETYPKTLCGHWYPGKGDHSQRIFTSN